MTYHRLNLFPITNLKDLSCDYRLYEITGLPPGDHLNHQLSLLTKKLAFDLKVPVALVRRDNGHYITLPASTRPDPEQSLTPHVATLIAQNRIERLDFKRLTPETEPIAASFLQYVFRTPLMRRNDLWGNGRTYFYKTPMNVAEPHRDVDMFGGFYHVIIIKGDQIFLLVELTSKYVDTAFLTERANGSDLDNFRLRHCLYQYGQRWFRVQFRGITGRSIQDQKFTEEQTGQVHTVYDYTRSQSGKPHPDYIQTLDPSSPAILYRYPGNEKERYGAAALCRLLFSTSDPRVKRIHARSIVEPENRFREIAQIVNDCFDSVYLGDTKVQVDGEPISALKKFFPVPDQRFGHDTVLHVKRHINDDGIDIKQLGPTRLRYLLSENIGSLGAAPFSAQYLFIPQSLPRDISNDFQEQLLKTVQQFSPHPFRITPILYDNRQARSLVQQVRAFEYAVQHNRISRGYGLLILPENADTDLHNFLKRHFWPDLQFQCVTAHKIQSHYEKAHENGRVTHRLRRELQNKFASYLRYTACGLLSVNRMWPWALETPLHYDAYIGLDVLNSRAGFTFVYQNGRHIFFEDFPSKQKEKLTRAQMESILVETLQRHLTELNIRPRSLVIHRDGRTFDSELVGIQRAIKRLISADILTEKTLVGVVDIRKTSTFPLRIVEERYDGMVVNPRLGSYHVFPNDNREGFICNTGWPFSLPGTVKPLHVCIISGDLNIHWVLEDNFALSQLIYAAPDRCARLPLTIKQADDFLEPIAAEFDEERALYGDEDAIDEEDEEEAEAVMTDTLPTS